MNTIKINEIKIITFDYSSDYHDLVYKSQNQGIDVDGEELFVGYTEKFLDEYYKSNCPECEYDDPNYYCTNCDDNQEIDEIEFSPIAKHIDIVNSQWVIGNERSLDLRKLFEQVLPFSQFIVIVENSVYRKLVIGNLINGDNEDE